MLLKLSPPLQLFIAAAAGAMAASATDVLVNGSSSGVAKAAELFRGDALPSNIASAAAWSSFALIGLASCAWFRPLTRQSACLLAFGSAAVFAMLVPAS
jgi:hypothetical protein